MKAGFSAWLFPRRPLSEFGSFRVLFPSSLSLPQVSIFYQLTEIDRACTNYVCFLLLGLSKLVYVGKSFLWLLKLCSELKYQGRSVSFIGQPAGENKRVQV